MSMLWDFGNKASGINGNKSTAFWNDVIYPDSRDMYFAKRTTWMFSDGVLPTAIIIAMSMKDGGTVVSGPVEEGSFASYNKTTEPFEISATLAFQGTDTYLQSIITDLKTLKNSVTTFSIITPYEEYKSMTLESYSYEYSLDKGLGILYIDAEFKEIREIMLSYTKQQYIPVAETKTPDAASTEDAGSVQASADTDGGSDDSSGDAGGDDSSGDYGGGDYGGDSSQPEARKSAVKQIAEALGF